MNTLFLLMARHDGRPMLAADQVCKDYFAPLTYPVFLRKITAGEIALPLVRMEASQKGAKMVHLSDLAQYIDERRKAAQKEARQLQA